MIGDGQAKESYEIFRVNKMAQIDEQGEISAREHLRTVISYLQMLKRHIEMDRDRIRDFKKILVG